MGPGLVQFRRPAPPGRLRDLGTSMVPDGRPLPWPGARCCKTGARYRKDCPWGPPSRHGAAHRDSTHPVGRARRRAGTARPQDRAGQAHCGAMKARVGRTRTVSHPGGQAPSSRRRAHQAGPQGSQDDAHRHRSCLRPEHLRPQAHLLWHSRELFVAPPALGADQDGGRGQGEGRARRVAKRQPTSRGPADRPGRPSLGSHPI